MNKKIKSCILSLIILSALLIGCDIDNIGGSENYGLYFSIPIYDYSDFHYLIDTLYKSSFLDYCNNTTGVLAQHTYDNQILSNDISFEVWVQADYYPGGGKRSAVAHILLPEEPVGGYSDTLINTTRIPGIRFFGSFRKLNPDEYYISEYAGMIGLKINMPDYFHAGIVYKTQDGKKYGIGSYESAQTDTLLLKMFKTDNQSPDQTPLAWQLKLKNVYRLPINNVLQKEFFLYVYFYENGVYISKLPGMTKQLLEIINLDRYQPNSHIPPPDGMFDFLPGYTIIPETGDIIFPTFRPFYDEFRDEGVDSVYWCPEIYGLSKTVAQNTQNATRFFIRGYANCGN
ncbi:hypothetical protein ACFLSV_05085 [Bacteroidota bacterium]